MAAELSPRTAPLYAPVTKETAETVWYGSPLTLTCRFPPSHAGAGLSKLKRWLKVTSTPPALVTSRPGLTRYETLLAMLLSVP